MNNTENMLDWGLKIPVSTGDTIVLDPQDANCYFVLSGNVDGTLTFDISNLTKELLFGFNVILKDLVNVGTLQFKFINNGSDVTIGTYEGLNSDFSIDNTGIYCFACNVTIEGTLNGQPVYTAAVNLAYHATLP